MGTDTGEAHDAQHLLRTEGALIRHVDLTFLSPYATSNLKRLGTISACCPARLG